MAGIRFQCHACGQHIEAPAEAAGCPVPCPSCQSPLRVPAASEPAVVPPAAGPGSVLCAICQSTLNPGEPETACPECTTRYHTDCWQDNGGCAVYGCSKVPEVEQRRSIEIPISYWGQENKPCPSCGREILAAAVRCRYCGATFDSAQPEDADSFQRRTERAERLPAMKRTVVWIFICSVLPCLAPIGAVWGVIWYSTNRQHLHALPSVYPALCKIGLAVAIGQCVLIVLMSALYALVRAE